MRRESALEPIYAESLAIPSAVQRRACSTRCAIGDTALYGHAMQQPATQPATESPDHQVRLRPVLDADIPEFFRFQCDAEGARMAAVIPRDAETFFPHWEKVLVNPEIIARAITLNGVLVGQIARFKLDDLDAVGYWIDRPYWGKGIASRGLSLFLDEVKTRPLYARAARHNAASIRVLERCGFALVKYITEPATDRFPECERCLFVLE